MKNLTLIVLLGLSMVSVCSTHAQDTLKTCAKSWTAELNVNPFQGQISFNNTLNQIKVRHFVSDQLAYRLAFNINNIKKENGQSNVYGANPVENSNVRKSTTFGINFGLERHFTGTRRLSPYLGAELAFGYKDANETISTKQSTTEIEGGWQTPQTLQLNNGNGIYNYISGTIYEVGYQSFGANLVAGFDYYISKNFFFGYEMLFGFNYTEYTKVETTVTPKPGQGGQSGTITNYPDQTGKEHSIGPRIINGIRLGYTF
ncbi:MAG: hypothetical protein JNL03_05510 [Prolixibacteraceae bacterium]|nr:hypothetical protein [Prolixibacteraceae bacterium]